MSVDPASASAGAAVTAAAIEAMIQAEVDALAADAQLLQSQVSTGQVVTATVQPSNGLTDIVTILGSRVAASLPPTLQPGDSFTAQVTGFNGPQILLQMLSTIEAADAANGQPVPAPVVAESPPTALQAAATPPVLPEGVTSSIAPPPAVFVAASVRPAAPAPGAPLQTPPPSAQAIQVPVGVLADIEARLAAARAGQVTVNIPTGPAFSAPPPQSPVGLASSPPPQLPGAPAAPPQAAGAQAPPQQAPAVPPIAGRYALPPNITPSARFNGPASATPVPVQAETPAPAGIASYRDPLPLVRALGLPVTPTNLAAAKLAIDTPQRLPAALATLESALPDTNDPRVATLRTLTAFIGKIDPGSPQLAAQLSAFVDNVVTGNEPKLAQLLTAQLVADQPIVPPTLNAQGQPIPADPSLPAALQPEATYPALALAQLAERGAALSVDLKTQLLSIINAPPNGIDAADLVPAASTALTAVTAIQMNAAQAMNASPQTMAFTIPMWLGSGYAQANINIDRDAPEQAGGKSLDGDNFHIAFVLTTKNLGTVTVDLQTVGRAFALAVRTENEKSAQRFGDNLSRLTDRLETLRYQVKSAEAAVAPRGAVARATIARPADDAIEGIPSDVNVRA
jgi:hypothetical protein